MIRTKGEAGTGDVVEAVRHAKAVARDIEQIKDYPKKELESHARRLRVPFELLQETVKLGRLPVVNFAAGGIATPADAALMMQMGCDGVFVGSGIFKSGNAKKRAEAIVQAVTHFKDAEVLAKVSSGLGDAMVGIDVSSMRKADRMASRGW